jgi:hypothetical protein
MQNRLEPQAPNIELALGSGDRPNVRPFREVLYLTGVETPRLRSQPRFQTQFVADDSAC